MHNQKSTVTYNLVYFAEFHCDYFTNNCTFLLFFRVRYLVSRMNKYAIHLLCMESNENLGTLTFLTDYLQ